MLTAPKVKKKTDLRSQATTAADASKDAKYEDAPNVSPIVKENKKLVTELQELRSSLEVSDAELLKSKEESVKVKQDNIDLIVLS